MPLAKYINFHAALVCLLACVQAWVYYDFLGFGKRALTFPLDGLALTCLLVLLSSIFLLPSLLLSVSLAKLQKERAARWVAWILSFAASCFLCTDLASLKVSGNHLLFHIPFLLDVLSGYGLAGFDLVGGVSAILKSVLVQSLLSVSLVAASWFLAKKWTGALEERKSLLFAPLVLGSLTVTLSPFLWSDLVTPVYSTRQLPLQVPLYEELVQSLGERGLRITGFNASGNDDDSVMLKNFGSPVELENWTLRSRNSEVALSGKLDSKGETEVALELDTKRDSLQLLDAEGKVRDQLQYDSRSFALASEVLVSSGNEDLQASAELLQQALAVSLNASEPHYPKLSLSNKPHVILLILESWAPDSLNPKDMPLLWKWSEKGIFFQDHYSGSNTTPMGIYSILYGRSPILYRHDLSNGYPPPMVSMLREQGYKALYRSPTDWKHWMWLGKIINSESFDNTKDLTKAFKGGWTDWSKADITILSEFLQTSQSSQEPVFMGCKLMTTHFPYTFLPQFDLNKPSLSDNYDMAELQKAETEVLKNRYKNSLATLDSVLDRFLHEVPLENTVVIIVGDHGESIWDDGTLSHGTLSSRFQMATPCLMLGKGVPALKVERVSSSLDVLPTLFEVMAGAPVDLSSFCQGESVLQASERQSVPLVPLTHLGNYQLLFTDGTQQLQFNLRSQTRLPGRTNLGPINPNLTVTFAGTVDQNGRLRRNLQEDFPFAEWEARIQNWDKVFRATASLPYP